MQRLAVSFSNEQLRMGSSVQPTSRRLTFQAITIMDGYDSGKCSLGGITKIIETHLWRNTEGVAQIDF